MSQKAKTYCNVSITPLQEPLEEGSSSACRENQKGQGQEVWYWVWSACAVLNGFGLVALRLVPFKGSFEHRVFHSSDGKFVLEGTSCDHCVSVHITYLNTYPDT